jgi:hypothetical protein
LPSLILNLTQLGTVLWSPEYRVFWFFSGCLGTEFGAIFKNTHIKNGTIQVTLLYGRNYAIKYVQEKFFYKTLFPDEEKSNFKAQRQEHSGKSENSYLIYAKCRNY